MNHIKIKELPAEQRPYEKCISMGASALTDNELLAIILRSGTKDLNSLHLADIVLSATGKTAFPGLQGLYHMSVRQLMELPGIGKVKAVQLLCIGELSRRMASSSAKNALCMADAASIAEYFMERLRHEEQEHLYSLMLDAKNRYLGEQLITRGTGNSTLVSPREIYIEALRRQALGVVLIHNHPSGDPSPSDYDIDVTERMFVSGEMIGIPLMDHIIIGDQEYFSFREQGLLNTDDF